MQTEFPQSGMHNGITLFFCAEYNFKKFGLTYFHHFTQFSFDLLAWHIHAACLTTKKILKFHCVCVISNAEKSFTFDTLS